MSSPQDPPADGEFGAEYWEDRYRHGQPRGPHAPSPSLSAEAAGLAPGRALDAGCGRGADAVWLAAHGWRVTGVDVSATALAAAEQASRAAGPDVAARVEWVCGDLMGWDPGERRFDLVTCQYVHAPGPARDLFQRLASWVAPGGTLLVAGHDEQAHDRDGVGARGGAADGSAHDAHPGGAPVHEHPPHARLRTDQVTAALDGDGWTVLVAGPRTHTRRRPGEGSPVVLRDVVVKARRSG